MVPGSAIRPMTLVRSIWGTIDIFTEDAVSASVAEALASDVGVETTVLSPVETVADGDDYIAVMTRNLDALRTALDCA